MSVTHFPWERLVEVDGIEGVFREPVCGDKSLYARLTINPAQVTCPQCLECMKWITEDQPVGKPRMEEVLKACKELREKTPTVLPQVCASTKMIQLSNGHWRPAEKHEEHLATAELVGITPALGQDVEIDKTGFEKALEAWLNHVWGPIGTRAEKVAGYIPSIKEDVSEWGFLPLEPCRFCREQGCVYFNIDEGPEGKVGLQVQRCNKCHRDWIADSSSA